jgi:hypothetical protein
VTKNSFGELDPGHVEKKVVETPQEVPIVEAMQGKETPEAREMSMPEREEEQGNTAT